MLASTLRLATVVVLCVLVVKEILHPERDAVRATYADDPDGGVLDGAPDAPWLDRWRRPADERTVREPAHRHLTQADRGPTTSGFAGSPPGAGIKPDRPEPAGLPANPPQTISHAQRR